MSAAQQPDAQITVGTIFTSETAAAGFVVDTQGELSSPVVMTMAMTLVGLIAQAEQESTQNVLMDMLEMAGRMKVGELAGDFTKEELIADAKKIHAK